ncbi:plasmid segregation protein ParM domain-containing protein [Microbulbifer epialgicus]|uniref:Plasmid segregation protein ParM domain-containing protein n=1 Tax=Microbulbifer epialgicus TaxID=393907 RepID=A0ABV4NUJ5_9GAMM
MAKKVAPADLQFTPVYGDEITDVAVDNGYADQKVAFWHRNHKGEHAIAEMLIPSRAQMGAINISIDGNSSGVYEIDGDPWTVGRDVTEPESIRGQKYAYSELNTVLVNHSLIAAGFSGRSVRISTGLPFDHFFKNGQKNQLLIDRVKKSMAEKVKPRGEISAAIIKEHILYPESTAAYVDYAVDEVTGEMKNNIETGLAVVDIGGNTTDITYINPNNTINTDRSGSRNLGVLNVRDRLSRQIKEDFGVDELRDAQLDSALRSGVCQIFGKKENVEKQIETAKRMSTKKLMNYVDEVIGDAADLDLVLFVGGGAQILRDIIKEYPHAHVPDRPQFANARGMLKYMTFVN